MADAGSKAQNQTFDICGWNKPQTKPESDLKSIGFLPIDLKLNIQNKYLRLVYCFVTPRKFLRP